MSENEKERNGGSSGSKEFEVVRIATRLERAVDAADRVLAGGTDLSLDFADCQFISVDGLEWLEEILLRSDSQGTKVTFVNLKPTLYKVFKVAHIDSLQRACGAPSSTAGPVC